MEEDQPTVCVLDASSYVGFYLLKELRKRGYSIHAAAQLNGNKEITKKIKEMERNEGGKVKVFEVDVLDYQSVVVALNGCSGLFCCLEFPHRYDETTVEMEVRGAINIMEACAQTYSLHKIVFNSSLSAAIWRDNIALQKDVDERSWTDQDYCRKLKLWYPLAKTLSEQASWALAVDRMLSMVSVNSGLVLGPNVTDLNPSPTMSYLKGAPQMYENGVLAYVDVEFLVDVHIRMFEDPSSCGRYFCFNEVVNNDGGAYKLAERLSPLISPPASYEGRGSEVFVARLRRKKLNKLLENASAI